MAKLATLAQYKQLMDDRPVKFLPADVDFREDNLEGYPCAGCIHWYRGAVMEHDVCEVVRPPNEQVPALYTCQFWTMNGSDFPKLNGDAQ